MDYTNRCESELLKHLKSQDVKYIHERPYFGIEQLNYLPKVILDIAEIDELAIEAYYIENNRRLELQEYSLALRVVDIVRSREHYFLSVTDKEHLSEIDTDLLTMLDNTYYEIQIGHLQDYIDALNHYIEFMSMNEPKIIKEQRASDGEHEGVFYKLL